MRAYKSILNCMAYGELGRTSLVSVVEHIKNGNFLVYLTEGKASKLTSIMLGLVQKLHHDAENDFSQNGSQRLTLSGLITIIV